MIILKITIGKKNRGGKRGVKSLSSSFPNCC
jgi:hypothetical protein